MSRPLPEAIELAMTALVPVASWQTQREPRARETRLAFKCRAEGSIWLSDAALDDCVDLGKLLMGSADSLFWGRHYARQHNDYEPHLTCPRCCHVMPIPNVDKLSAGEQFEFCERMAVLWMERADVLRRQL